MITLIKALLWDPAAVRALVVWAGGVGASVLLQPIGRSMWEKMLYGALASLVPAAASLPSAKKD